MTIKYGIMGLGGIAHRFTKVIQSMEGSKLIAVSSSDLARAKNFANKYGIEQFYGDYNTLVKNPDIDAVYIAQTHDKHFELIKLCIENGKAVICEKPMVLTVEEAKEVKKLSENNNVLVMEAFWTRFIPTYIKAKEWVDTEKIGAVKFIQASFCFNLPFDPTNRLFKPETAGGSLYDAGIYPIEFTTGILGEPPKDIKAVGTFYENGVDEFVSMSMKFKSGAIASLSCGFSTKVSMDAHIYGDKGAVIVKDFLGSRRVELLDINHNVIDLLEIEFEDGFIYEIEHFSKLIRDGIKESPIMPLKESIESTTIFKKVMEEIR